MSDERKARAIEAAARMADEAKNTAPQAGAVDEDYGIVREAILAAPESAERECGTSHSAIRAAAFKAGRESVRGVDMGALAGIVDGIVGRFKCFGGGSSLVGPTARARKGTPPVFAAGVDVEEVVRFVASALRAPESAEREHEERRALLASVEGPLEDAAMDSIKMLDDGVGVVEVMNRLGAGLKEYRALAAPTQAGEPDEQD